MNGFEKLQLCFPFHKDNSHLFSNHQHHIRLVEIPAIFICHAWFQWPLPVNYLPFVLWNKHILYNPTSKVPFHLHPLWSVYNPCKLSIGKSLNGLEELRLSHPEEELLLPIFNTKQHFFSLQAANSLRPSYANHIKCSVPPNGRPTVSWNLVLSASVKKPRRYLTPQRIAKMHLNMRPFRCKMSSLFFILC